MTEITYEPKKFRELIVYVASKFNPDEMPLGDVKLNKILFFSDFVAYNRLGSPITGATYRKQLLGPVAAPLLPARRQLIEEEAIRVDTKQLPAPFSPQTITVALRAPTREMFEDAQLELVDAVAEELRSATANEASDMSHERSPGWKLSEMAHVIPYFTALVPPTGPSPAAMELARATED